MKGISAQARMADDVQSRILNDLESCAGCNELEAGQTLGGELRAMTGKVNANKAKLDVISQAQLAKPATIPDSKVDALKEVDLGDITANKVCCDALTTKLSLIAQAQLIKLSEITREKVDDIKTANLGDIAMLVSKIALFEKIAKEGKDVVMRMPFSLIDSKTAFFNGVDINGNGEGIFINTFDDKGRNYSVQSRVYLTRAEAGSAKEADQKAYIITFTYNGDTEFSVDFIKIDRNYATVSSGGYLWSTMQWLEFR